MFGDMIHPAKRLARYQADLAGVKHLHRITPTRPEPGQPISLHLTTDGSLPFDGARCWFTTDDRHDARASLDMHSNGSRWDTISWGYLRHWECILPQQPAGTMINYHLAAHVAGSETWVFADDQANTPGRANNFAVWVDDVPVPAWTREAVVYQIFVDRFYPGDGRSWKKPRNLSGFFGGTLDFLLADALRKTFGQEIWTLADFEAFLAGHESYFPSSFSRPAFLDNHDMNRILYLAGNDKTKVKLAALVLFSLNGPPIVYNGTEVGITQGRALRRFEEARRPMLWGNSQDRELLTYFRRLLALRRKHPAICSLESRGYTIEDILDYLNSKVRRMGREILDQQGFFPELPMHQDGSRWVFWAEEVEIDEPQQE